MDKKAIFNHYSDILDELLDSMFFMTYFQRPYYLENTINWEDYDEIPAHISIHDGATRGCIVDDNYDYVVKYDVEDDPEYGSACKREIELYSIAKENNLQQYFIEATYVGTYYKKILFYDINEIEQHCDWYGYDAEEFDEELMEHEDEMTLKEILISVPLYAYHYANKYNYSQLDESLISSAQKIESPLRDKNIAVATAFIQEYGFNEYERLTNFMFENDINDIHLGNIGEIDGHLCITDWNGYHED